MSSSTPKTTTTPADDEPEMIVYRLPKNVLGPAPGKKRTVPVPAPSSAAPISTPFVPDPRDVIPATAQTAMAASSDINRRWLEARSRDMYRDRF